MSSFRRIASAARGAVSFPAIAAVPRKHLQPMPGRLLINGVPHHLYEVHETIMGGTKAATFPIGRTVTLNGRDYVAVPEGEELCPPN